MADTYDGEHISRIEIDLGPDGREIATINGSTIYPGMAVSWTAATGQEYDVALASSTDREYAGAICQGGNLDPDTVFADNETDCYVAGIGSTAWVKYKASGGAIQRGEIVSATTGYYHIAASAQYGFGRFVCDADGITWQANTAGVTIVKIKVESLPKGSTV